MSRPANSPSSVSNTSPRLARSSRPDGRQAIGHGLPASVIANARQDTDRLVHQQVGPRRDRLDQLAIDGHPVGPRGDLLAGNGRRPVHEDLS
jgi:hypothetical protein